MRALLIVLVLLAALVGGLAIGLIGRSAFGVSADRPGQPNGVSAAGASDTAPQAQADVARGEVALEIGEEELARELNARLAGQGLGATPIGDAAVERFTASLRNGQVQIGGDARVGAAGAPFTVVGQVAPSGDGRPVVRVTDARVAGAPMPDAVRERIEQTLQAEFDRQFARRPMRVRSVEVGGGRLRAIGAPRA